MQISVIITTFNREKKLKRAIKSVLNQTFKDFELIIVDDCSNDGTQKLCQKYVRQDSRVRYFRNDVNSGRHPFGKNRGTKEARTGLIAYLDDDNEYRRDHLQVLYKYLENYDIVYGDRWLIDETKYGGDRLGIRSDFNAQLLYQQNYIDTSDVLVKKNVLEKVGGWDESLPKFADWNLWVRLCKARAKFKHIPIIITDYYLHSESNQFKHKNKLDQYGRILPTYFEPDSCKIWAEKTLYGERSKLKVAVFTLTMNRLDYTKQTWHSMSETANYPFDWFVVDNGSDDGTPQWLFEMVKAKHIKQLISNEKNVGISKGSNQALEAIGKDYDIVIKVDNDCKFLTDNWLMEIINLYERQKGIVVAPRVEGLRDSPGGVPRTQYCYVGNHFLGLAPHLGGICIAAPLEIYDQFRWEEDDFLHGEQDYVFSQYAISRGYMLAYMENLIVEHIEGTETQQKKYPEYFEKRKQEKMTRYEQI